MWRIKIIVKLNWKLLSPPNRSFQVENRQNEFAVVCQLNAECVLCTRFSFFSVLPFMVNKDEYIKIIIIII